MTLHRACSIVAFILFFVSYAAAQQPQSPSADIVSRQTIVMTQPPRNVPSGTVVDGPILGNGDVGVAIGGLPQEQRFYIGKNDFWSQMVQDPMTVGGVQLSIPALDGASYREEEDLLNAEVRGTFTKAGVTIKTSSWVAATENLLVSELKLESGADVEVHATLFPAGTAISNNNKSIEIGREQHEKGRWYFNGLIDEVHLYDRALDQGEISKLKNFDDPAQGLVRRWGFDAEEGTTPQDSKTTLFTGPSCNGTPPVLRPDERPIDDLGCLPDGWHYDYQPYGLGIRGRAAKFMHSWRYVDAGKVPDVRKVTVSAWIYIFSAGDNNFILSKGDWNEAYSLSLDQGRLRFNVGDRFARSWDALPTHQWVHVAGTFDGMALRAYVNGQEITPKARFISGGSTSDTVWITRNADGPLDEEYDWPNPLPPTRTSLTRGREVSFAARLVGAQGTIRNGEIDFILPARQSVYLVTPILSDLDDADHHAAALARAQALKVPDILKVRVAHRDWWKQFWSQSFVEIDEPLLEKYYYSSEYITASASRDGKVAPGLYGPWVTTDHPSWNSNYTMDYNYQTAPLAMYSSNHIATAGSYDQPVLDFIGRGQLYARTLLNARGVLYPGNMAPWGLERQFEFEPMMGMKSNAAFTAMPMLMRFYSTYDDAYAAKIYPFLREVGNFWEDNLDRSHHTYSITGDCADEVGPWLRSKDWATCSEDHNPMSTLGFVRATFQGLIDISKELNVDASHRSAWQDILDHLSPYPTTQRSGRTFFLVADGNASNMPDWGNASWAIWPAGQIGLGKDPRLTAIARNNFEEPPRPPSDAPAPPPLVNDPTAPAHPDTPSTAPPDFMQMGPLTPPAMARVGFDPAKLLAALHSNCVSACYPNGYLFFGGGGVEGPEVIPATINEMLMQSFSGVLYLFPDWPRDKSASFGDLRAYGAFLVSSDFKNGRVGQLTILSEKGRDCVLKNPWQGKELRLSRNGRKAERLAGDQVTFHTVAGESISIQPE